MGHEALALGLAAAIIWGVVDFFVGVFSRRVGYLPTMLVDQAGGVALLLAVSFVEVRSGDTTLWLAALALAPLNALVLVTFFKGMELGPIAIVSPITAASVVITLGLSILILGEHLQRGQTIGVAITVAGIVLASVAYGEMQFRRLQFGRGVVFGLATMFTAGVFWFSIAVVSRHMGWYDPLVVSRIGSLAVLTVFAKRAGGVKLSTINGRWVMWMGALGALETVGFIAFLHGAAVGEISLVAASASAYPLIPIVGGVALLGERLAISQRVGACVVVAGLIVLGISG